MVVVVGSLMVFAKFSFGCLLWCGMPGLCGRYLCC